MNLHERIKALYHNIRCEKPCEKPWTTRLTLFVGYDEWDELLKTAGLFNTFSLDRSYECFGMEVEKVCKKNYLAIGEMIKE